MNRLDESVAGSANPGAVLDELAVHGILLPNRDELEAYLADHPELARLMGAMCEKVRAAFGPAVELSLETYADPEIDDRYLTLYVRQDPYTPTIIDRIDRACSEFHRSLEAVSGYFLVTTDFRRPRGVNGF